MYLYILVVVISLVDIQAGGAASSGLACPTECNCTTINDDTVAATCVTQHPQITVNYLPQCITHLELLFSQNVAFQSDITFAHLPALRFLLVATQEKYTAKHDMRVTTATFRNNTHLEVFHSSVRLTWKDFNIFSRLSNLTELGLSNTRGGWNQLKLVANQSLSHKTKLSKLYLESFCENGHSEWEVRGFFSVKNIFGGLNDSKIRELDLSSNELHYIAPDWVGGFHYLEYLDISYNMLCYQSHAHLKPLYILIGILTLLPELKTLNVGHQGMYAPYKMFSNWKAKQDLMKSEIQFSTGSFESQQTFHSTKCIGSLFPISLGNIEKLIAPELTPTTLLPITGAHNDFLSCFKFSKNNKVLYMDLQDNANVGFMFASGWKSLVLLNLDKLRVINIQRGGANGFHETFFSNFSSLEVALLGGNNLGASLLNHSYFSNNMKLKVLDLAENGISQFPGDFFQSTPFLTQLNVSGNRMYEWTANITSLTNLVMLNISYNRFSNISESFRSQLELLEDNHDPNFTSPGGKQLIVDLQGNPLSCLCQDISSVEWIQRTSIELYNRKYYTCTHPAYGRVSLMMVNLNELKKYCFPDKKLIIVVSALSSSVSTLFLVLIVTLYCKRWHLRYWLYLLRKGWKKYHRDNDETEYEYDVFIAHSTEDGDWVTGPLYEELEVKRGLRLCLYQRDILPNEILVEAIVDRIDKSRHTLLVLTPSFVASNWCHFEMHIAHVKWSEEGKDMIFPIILRSLPPYSVSRTLHYLLKRKVYLEWPDDTLRQELFWERLASSLGAPEQEPVSSGGLGQPQTNIAGSGLCDENEALIPD